MYLWRVAVDGMNVPPLTYLGDGHYSEGDAVQVPFGKTVKQGLIVGEGEEVPNMRTILQKYGKRTDKPMLEAARTLAEFYGVDEQLVYKTLCPAHFKGNSPGRRKWEDGEGVNGDAFYFVHPSVDLKAAVKNAVSQHRKKEHQSLVIVGSKILAQQIADIIPGAAFLDPAPGKQAANNWKGFVEGSIQIGVVTRAGVLWGTSSVKTIVVVDDVHAGLFELKTPYWNAADVALLRARHTNAEFVTVSHRPSRTSLKLPVQTIKGKVKCTVSETAKFEWGSDVYRAYHTLKQRNKELPLVVASSHSIWWCSACKDISKEEKACETCGNTKRNELSWSPRRLRKLLGDDIPVVTESRLLTQSDDWKTAKAILIPDIDSFLYRETFTLWSAGYSILQGCSRVAGVSEIMMLTANPNHPLLKFMVGDLQAKDILGYHLQSYTSSIKDKWVVEAEVKDSTREWKGLIPKTTDPYLLEGYLPAQQAKALHKHRGSFKKLKTYYTV